MTEYLKIKSVLKTKEAIDVRIKELENKISDLKEERRPFEVAERIRDRWELGFGWPRISQELQLKKKLDPETYEKLYKEVADIIDDVALEVEDPPTETLTTWQKVKAVFQ